MLEQFDATLYLDENQITAIEKWAQPKAKEALKTKLQEDNENAVELLEFFDEEVRPREDYESLIEQWRQFVNCHELPKLKLDEWQKKIALKKISNYMKEYEPDFFEAWILMNKMLMLSQNLNLAFNKWLSECTKKTGPRLST